MHVHPLDQDGMRPLRSNYLRFRVRMSKRQLMELMAQVDLSQGNEEELGRLILKECLEGRLNARVFAAGYRV